ncbi:MAG TPA: 8-amino-7-oxononanoate synthase [Verrucomicrobiae bacterium]|nr:8-amino-7-oxononanoate synthase [Verrucomicrobiae bacterium]
MSTLDDELGKDLAELQTRGLHRSLRQVESPQCPHLNVDGAELLNFSSNDYLGLANDPSLKDAARRALERYGAGSGASRLICGSLRPHHELEETLADFKGTECAVTFSSGYAAALGVITALLSRDDVVILDKLVHASIVDAARLSGAQIRVFPHNDLNRLEALLQWTDRSKPEAETGTDSKRRKRVLVATESVFSMDGDQAPLTEIVQLKERYGAWLMVDEAHATGLYGIRRRGLAENLNLSQRVEIQLGTLGKALGSSGGCICGSRRLVEYLVNRARSFIFSTAPAPAAAAAATAGVRLVQSPVGEARCKQLWEHVATLRPAIRVPAPSQPGAIVPVGIGGEAEAMEIAQRLREKGIYIPAIRYPTVARGRARLRLTLSAAHSGGDVQRVIQALAELGLAHDTQATSPHAFPR